MVYIICMEMFANRLKGILTIENKKSSDVSKSLGFKDKSMVNRWLRAECLPKLNYSIKIADFFGVSLDYLFGKTKDFEEKTYKQAPPFDEQLRNILKEFNKTQYRLLKDGVCSFGNFYSWFTLKSIPNMDSVIKIADYLGVSLDYLVGRE